MSKEKDYEAFKELCEITALLNRNAQRNAVTVPADKLAELQRKAKLVDELLEVLEGASEVIDYIDEWNVPIRLSTRIKEVIAKTKGEL